MDKDIPPTDEEILNMLRATEDGLTPSDLLDALRKEGYSRAEVVQAFQRVVERGLVTLSSGARLVPSEVKLPEAA